MKSFLIALVLLFFVAAVQSVRVSTYFEFTCGNEYFEPQKGQTHLIVKYKDSSVEDSWRKGFNFSTYEKDSKERLHASLDQEIGEVSSFITYWTKLPWDTDNGKDLVKPPFILFKNLMVAPYIAKSLRPDLKKARYFCPKEPKMRLKQEVELFPCEG